MSMNNIVVVIKNAVIVAALGLGVVAVAPVTSTVAAAAEESCSDTGLTIGKGVQCAKSNSQKGDLTGIIKDITNVLLFLIGAVAVIMIIIGGIRYVISNGDSNQVTAAKNTILYGVIGVVVALLAFAIVNFVVTTFTDSTATPGGGNNISN